MRLTEARVSKLRGRCRDPIRPCAPTSPLDPTWADAVRVRGTACVVATIGILGCAATVAPLSGAPDDVTQFVNRRQTCDHFRGEEPYSPERRAQIEEAAEKYCRGSDRELAALRSKYQGNATVLKVLDEYENDIEAK